MNSLHHLHSGKDNKTIKKICRFEVYIFQNEGKSRNILLTPKCKANGGKPLLL